MLANNLRHLRGQLGFSAARLDKQFGLGKNSFSNYETKGTQPTLQNLVQFAKFFNASLDDLVIKDLSKGDIPSQEPLRNILHPDKTDDNYERLLDDKDRLLKEKESWVKESNKLSRRISELENEIETLKTNKEEDLGKTECRLDLEE